MHPWFSWLRWLNPVYYGVEALLSSELAGLELECVQPQLAPYGPGYTGDPQGCAIAGAVPGSLIVSGTSYSNLAFAFYQSHVWRNYGIIVALGIGFLTLCCIQTERLPAANSNRAVLLYKRGGGGKYIKQVNKNGTDPRDEEEGAATVQVGEKPRIGSEPSRQNSTVSVHAASET